MAKARRDIAQEVTDLFIETIEQGLANEKWVRPWAVLGMPATNVLTGKRYNGINAILLMMAGGGEWGTYRQWQQKDAQVRKGEKGAAIFVPMFKKDDQGDDELIGWKAATVFNASQVDGYETPVVAADKEFIPCQAAEAFIAATGADIRYGNDKAYYVPSMDFIGMPNREQFNTEEDFYGTILHELIHWTGAKSRKDRKLDTNRFGDDAYAFEELVAELGAAMLCAELGIHTGFRDDHAKYLNHWLNVMKGDKHAIRRAASQAQAAIDYLMAQQGEEAVAA